MTKPSGSDAASREQERHMALMQLTLSVSVPFRMLDLEQRGGPTDDEWEFARAYGDELSEKGDRLMYREKKGETARLMADMIYAVAILAFAPGGVTLLGVHFDAGRPALRGHGHCRAGFPFEQQT